MVRATDRESEQPTISGAWLQHVLHCLREIGVPVAEILQDLRVEPEAWTDPDVRVPRDTATLVWQEAARRSGDPLLGLHAAAHFRLGLNTLLAHLMVSSASLGDALSAMVRYQTLVVAGTTVTLEHRGDVTAILVDPVEGKLPVSHHQTEFILGAIAQMIRSLSEEPVAFAGVRFRHASPGNDTPYRSAFACAAQFRADENSLLLAASALEGPCRERSASVARKLKGVAEEDLQSWEGPGLSHLVAVALRHRLAAGEFAQTSLENVARELRLSARSLQRRLAEERQTYAALFDATRRELAASMLEAGLPREAIASRLGFSSTTTLSRALRRWTRP
jgi:AraC-like DNA-binding protein